MQGKKRAGIHDVAREAGVSPATVSRVLNAAGYPVSEEVRKKVIQAADRLDYTPNQLGRMLKKNENRMIGIVVPTIANPFYSQIVIGIETEARRRGYGALLCNTFRDPEEENRCIQSLFEKQVMGIALSSVVENHALVRKALRQAGREDLIGGGSKCLVPAEGAIPHRSAKPAGAGKKPAPKAGGWPDGKKVERGGAQKAKGQGRGKRK